LAEGSIASATSVHFDGAGASLAWSIPFAGLLLSIAFLPLLAPRFWEHHFGKVAVFWALALIIPCAVVTGFWTATTEIVHTFLLDYLPFIILLFALFVVAGGIRVSGNLVGTPATNTAPASNLRGIGLMCIPLPVGPPPVTSRSARPALATPRSVPGGRPPPPPCPARGHLGSNDLIFCHE